jgi:hypothetical protein
VPCRERRGCMHAVLQPATSLLEQALFLAGLCLCSSRRSRSLWSFRPFIAAMPAPRLRTRRVQCAEIDRHAHTEMYNAAGDTVLADCGGGGGGAAARGFLAMFSLVSSLQIQLGFYRAELKKQGHTRKSLRQMEVLDAAEKVCAAACSCIAGATACSGRLPRAAHGSPLVSLPFARSSVAKVAKMMTVCSTTTASRVSRIPPTATRY